MNTGTITKEALNDYRAAIKSWLTLRNVQSTSQLRLAALLDTEAELKSCQSIFPPESAGIREKSLDAP